jgi:hypothetical protein
MNLTQTILWLSALGIVVLAIVLFRRQDSWRYRTETLPQLGKVEAAYDHGNLVHYRLRKHGVLLQIMCNRPEAVSGGVDRAQALSKQDIDRHLQHAVAAIPETELKPWGFDKGEWRMEAITFRGDGSLGFGLGNSSDHDHVCLVSLEDGRYTFEAVDG